MTTKTEPRVLAEGAVRHVHDKYGVKRSAEALHRLRRDGKLAALRMSGRWYFKLSDIDALIAAEQPA